MGSTINALNIVLESLGFDRAARTSLFAAFQGVFVKHLSPRMTSTDQVGQDISTVEHLPHILFTSPISFRPEHDLVP